MLLHNPDAENRKSLVDLLGKMRDSRAVGDAHRVIAGRARIPVCGACRAGSRVIGDRQAFDPLIATLNSPTEWVRSAAAWALGKLGDPRAADPLAASIPGNHPNYQVRAAHALLELGDPRGIDPSIDAIRQMTDNVSALRRQRICACPTASLTQCFRANGQIYQRSCAYDKEYFLRALANSRRPASCTIPFRPCLENPTQVSRPTRADAALAIGGIGYQPSVDRLADLATDEPDSAVRTAMALAAARDGRHSCQTPCSSRWRKTRPTWVAAHAIDAFATYNDPKSRRYARHY